MANAMTEDYVFYLDANLKAGLTASPTTPGHTLLHLNTKLFVDRDKTQRALASAKLIARRLCTVTSTERCGLAYDGDRLIHILPLHGLEADWSAVLNHDEEYHEEFPGYLSTKNGPKLKDEELDDIRKRVIQHSGLPNKLDISFHGDVSDQNLFARIVRGELPQWRLWEDASHVAFLTPFANSLGYTVLVPRRHLPSDIFSLEDQDYTALVDASCNVATLLKDALGSDSCGMFFEGLEIDYAHVKLVPVASRKPSDALQESRVEQFHERYDGSISTRLGPATYPLDKLEKMAGEMRSLF